MITSSLTLSFAFAVALLVQPAADFSQSAAHSKDLPNFYKVNDALYRGGQPTEKGFEELKRMGIDTIIDLRDDDSRAREEESIVKSAGLMFINLPMDNWDRPRIEDIDAILAQIDLASNKPVFVHCKRGSDRTGTVIAVYRMKHDRWTSQQAMDEAKKFGTGWWQHGMRDFINDYYRDHKNSH